MSELYWVICPHCNAAGQFSDPKLKGQEAFCPVCGEAFVVKAAPPPQVSDSNPDGATAGTDEVRTTPSGASRPVARSPLKIVVLGAFAAVGLLTLFVLSQKPPAPAVPDVTRIVEPETDVAVVKPAESPKQQPTEQPPTEQPSEVKHLSNEAKADIEKVVAEKNVPQLIKLLEDKSVEVRQFAAWQVSDMDPDPELAPALWKCLDDSDYIVRKASAKAFAKHGAQSPDAVPKLAAMLLKDPSWEVRYDAGYSLGALVEGNPERSQAAAKLLLDELDKPDVETGVMVAFGFLGEAAKPAIPKLKKLAEGNNHEYAAAGALAKLGHFETFPQLLKAKAPHHYIIADTIAEKIGELRPMTPAALAILQLMMEDNDPAIRRNAIYALKKAEPKLPAAIPLLERAQKDQGEFVSDAATEALVTYLDADPVLRMRTLLTEWLKADEHGRRFGKAMDLIEDTKTEGFGALVSILSDSKSTLEMRNAAGQILALSGLEDWWDPKQADALKKLLYDREQPLLIRTGCAVALHELRDADPRVATTLHEAILDPTLNYRVRKAAIPVFWSYSNDESATQALIAAAKQCEDPQPSDLSKSQLEDRTAFYSEVLRTMQHVRATDRAEVLPYLVKGIRHEHPWVKTAALATIEENEVGTPAVVAAIREAMNDSDEFVRKGAAEALDKVDEFAGCTMPELIEELKTADAERSALIAQTLGRRRDTAIAAVPDLIKILQNQQITVNEVPQALAKIAPENPEVISAILKALEDRPALREDVVAALKILGPPAGAAVPQLRKLLPESTGLLQRDILKALGAMEEAGKPAILDIVRYLTDENKSTREAAASAIGNLKQYAEPVLADLVKLLKDPEEDVQLQVLWSLERIGPVAKAVIPEVEKFVATTSNEELKKEGGRLLTQLKADPN